MKTPSFFQTQNNKKISLPIFFPDATRAVLKTLDSIDIKNTQTPGILVNTLHLKLELGSRILKKFKGVRNFMNWDGGVISDSGGFQVLSLVKSKGGQGKVTDEGVMFISNKSKKILLTPEKSIIFQHSIRPDMYVVLDDFTPPHATYEEAKKTVERTIQWAKRSKAEFTKLIKSRAHTHRPYLLAVVQGGEYIDLRVECTKRLCEIGFDGLGFGGWPIDSQGKFNYEVAKAIADNTPKNYFLYGLGVGKPDEIVGCAKMGYNIFDCVLPTRDARHKRLYVYNANNISDINVFGPSFYSYYVPDKEKHYQDNSPISLACDCHLCKNFSKAYLAHLFRIKDTTAMRLATIHNLRFYSILMEKLQKNSKQ